jgi:hypothetical protein
MDVTVFLHSFFLALVSFVHSQPALPPIGV